MKTILNIALLLVLLMCSFRLISQEKAGEEEIIVNSWLVAGPFEVRKPLFDSIEDMKGNIFQVEDLLKSDYFDVLDFRPADRNEIAWPGSRKSWKTEHAGEENSIELSGTGSKTGFSIVLAAIYINSRRWQEAAVEVQSPLMFEVFLDGEKVLSKYSFDKEEDTIPGAESVKQVFETGSHLLVVKLLIDHEKTLDHTLAGKISCEDSLRKAAFSIHNNPAKVMDINLLLDGVTVNSAKPSPDGSLMALSFSETMPPEGKKESWTEIRNAADELVYSFRNAKVTGLQWTGKGNRLSYKINGDNGSSLYVLDLDSHKQYVVLENVKDMSGYQWAPDGSYIIYAVSEKAEKDDSGLKKLEGMPDRWSWFRSRQFLYKADIKSGIRERLTYGHLSSNLQDISPDSRYLLFSQQYPDFSERPYSKQLMYLFDMKDYSLDTIWINNYGGGASFSPDGKKLLVTGSPVMFGDEGNNVTNGRIPNGYDTQAYIFDLKKKKADCITKTFEPSVLNVFWSKVNKNIYILAEDRTYKLLFRYDVKNRSFKELESGMDVLSRVNYANDALVAAYTGSSIQTPVEAYRMNLDSGDYHLITAPKEKQFEDVGFGKTEEWIFQNRKGVSIDGRVYFPPGFDPEKKYPLIVYYYGGTSPVSRSFGGRYPKNLFAAQGYIVYVLQPSGATGYGQNFSAMHVNNWGISVADEIIDGTLKFIEEHPFIDSTKIGCLGASYGGFMTMLLQTRTDIFACAISHAGISSISSYWGEGYWGYLYSSVATANSFPWNNKKIYVEQSPLFNADKINTPILLLHGNKDTNVPLGESLQLYTALKLLGKPVELIEVEGQDHHILDYKKRIKWQKTILAWFDKWLKDQPEWWGHLYPEGNL